MLLHRLEVLFFLVCSLLVACNSKTSSILQHDSDHRTEKGRMLKKKKSSKKSSVLDGLTLSDLVAIMNSTSAATNAISSKGKKGKEQKKTKGSKKSSESGTLTLADLVTALNSTDATVTNITSSKKKKNKNKNKKKGKTSSKESKKSGKDKKKKSSKFDSSDAPALSTNATSAPTTALPLLSNTTNSPASTVPPSVKASTKKKKNKGSKGSKSSSGSKKQRLKKSQVSSSTVTDASSVSTTQLPAPTGDPNSAGLPLISMPPLTSTPTSLLAPSTSPGTSFASSQPTRLPTTLVPTVVSSQQRLGSFGTAEPVSFPTAAPFADISPSISNTPTPTSLPTLKATTLIPMTTGAPEAVDTMARFAISPFTARYAIADSSASSTKEEMEETVQITLTFLSDHLGNVFERNEYEFESLLGTRAAFSADLLEIEYIAAAQFRNSSTLALDEAELDVLVQTAFSQPAVQTLLILLRNLPLSNSYSNTNEVVYRQGHLAAPSTEAASVGASGIAGITGAFLLAFCVTGAAAAYRKGNYGKGAYKKAPRSDMGQPVAKVGWASTCSMASSKNEEYCNRIIDGQDMEVRFYCPDTMDESSIIQDPLFQAPYLSGDTTSQNGV